MNARLQDAGGLQASFADGLAHHKAGRLAEAEAVYRHVLSADPHHGDSLHLLGLIAGQTGRRDLALAAIRAAIAVNPLTPPYHSSLGTLLQEMGHLDEAVACHRQAVALQPDFAGAYTNLGIALGRQGRLEEACAAYDQAIALRPDVPETHNNLGTALKDQGRLDVAVASFRRAIELRPGYGEAHNNLGAALKETGQLEDAIACFRRALSLNDGLADAHFNLATALLAQGDLERGWDEYEWRWRTPQMQRDARHFPQPQWRGEAGQGRTLLLHAEQGLGDTIQFCRYAPLAAARGWRVILQVPRPLVRLLRSLDGPIEVVACGDALPAFDMQCPLLSLPLAFRTTLASIPHAPAYLHADPAQAASWAARLAAPGSGQRLVGLAWAGNPGLPTDRRRSLDPALLAPLLEVPGHRFFSLQKDLAATPPGLVDVMHEIGDFAGTAALVSGLDLVICVDTAVAHLAAALGRPVWLLNRFDPDWRWLSGRRDSPWYPTLRQYPQPRPGDWGAVLGEVASDLVGACG